MKKIICVVLCAIMLCSYCVSVAAFSPSTEEYSQKLVDEMFSYVSNKYSTPEQELDINNFKVCMPATLGGDLFYICQYTDKSKLLATPAFSYCKNLIEIGYYENPISVSGILFVNTKNGNVYTLNELYNAQYYIFASDVVIVKNYTVADDVVYTMHNVGLGIDIVGNAYPDTSLTIQDVTHMQKELAQAVEFDGDSPMYIPIRDGNHDSNFDIKDVTYFQKVLADIY